MTGSVSRSRLLLLVLLSISGLIAVLFLSSGKAEVSAGSQSKNEPASEGRQMTPAGSLVLDAGTKLPTVGALPVAFVRSPDSGGPEGAGRYLLTVNSGFGLQFNSANPDAKQSIAVIDLAARPSPAVIQNIYFASPQSVNVGMVFAPQQDVDGSFALYVSGGFENKIWIFRFVPGASAPISPLPPGSDAKIEAPFIDLNELATTPATPRYNKNSAAVYPTGLAISPDGDTLYVANNLGDSLGVISKLHGPRNIRRVDLHRDNHRGFVYPYGVVALANGDRSMKTSKLYVSCWGDAALAVINANRPGLAVSYIPVERHPTAIILNSSRTRLYVVNSNADSVSVIDTAADREIERINVRLSEQSLSGTSPEGLALSADGATLYVANALSNAVAVVALGPVARGVNQADSKPQENEKLAESKEGSRVQGFIPTGQYPSALAIVGNTIFVGNGKGTGMENSSLVVDNSGRVPNAPNERFPAGSRGRRQGGEYSVALVAGNISAISVPGREELAAYTQQVMRNDGLIGERLTKLFSDRSPIKHIIYIIKENRAYDQVFGDVERSGDGHVADGDAKLAIFGAGETARSPRGARQDITPNQHALALRFGLFDRFFVNAEASPDGHNWSTAAFSSDYVDKAFRWNYSGRGRTYDFEGFNRLPNYEPSSSMSPVFHLPVTAADVIDYLREYVPYLFGGRDISEPETLYLWDAALRLGLSYRIYGEFVATISESDVAAINAGKPKPYPDTSATVRALPTKKSLEGHHSETFRAFDLSTPDSMTTDSYHAVKTSGVTNDPLITKSASDKQFQGTSRFGEWLKEFQAYAREREAGQTDRLPNLSIVRLSSDHTSGLRPGLPTPQFYVADNDYAVGRLVETVSRSQYWKDTAIFILEDDAQDGPDHVDAHRSPALVISAYNRPGALIHDFHNTVSLIRTMELLLGLPPINQLDDSASPMNVFRDEPDLRPYKASLPEVALDNLITPPVPRNSPFLAYWVRRTAEQDFSHADMADPRVLNQIIWFSVRGPNAPLPPIARLPAFDVMLPGGAAKEKEGDPVAAR